jgi:glycosyltransferase involved in cell wall biosynthesis
MADSGTKLPIVTVIMPVLNEASFIRQSLGAVLSQNYPPDRLEILIVDGGSTDATQTTVQEMFQNRPNTRLLYNPQRIQAAGLNLGILAATGQIIIRVDGHTVIAPNYVSACVRLLTQGKADNVGGLIRPRGTTYVGQAVALATSSPFGAGDAKFHYSQCEQYVDTVYLGAYWRKTFDQIGLYDPAVHINEDYELNYRLRQVGGRILLSPAIESTYTPRASLPALWRQYFIYGQQKVRMLHKHPASLRWRQAVPPLFVLVFGGSLLLSFIWSPVRRLFTGVAGLYLLANFVASTIEAMRGGWRYLPILPLVFATIHFAWGTGFWYGVMRMLMTNQRRN